MMRARTMPELWKMWKAGSRVPSEGACAVPNHSIQTTR